MKIAMEYMYLDVGDGVAGDCVRDMMAMEPELRPTAQDVHNRLTRHLNRYNSG